MLSRKVKGYLSVIIFLLLPTISECFDNEYNGPIENYTPENISGGTIKGGHDTITIEGFRLKQKVHQTEGDLEKFDEVLNVPIIPTDRSSTPFHSLRIGAHDEDSTKVKIPITLPPPAPPIPIYYQDVWLDDRPIGNTGEGGWWHHFYNPKTGKGLIGFGMPAPKRAADYIKEIKKIAGCTPGGFNNLSAENKRKAYEYFGKTMHLLQDMACPSHTTDDIHAFRHNFETYINDHWSDIVNSQAFKDAVTKDKYLSGSYKFTDISSYWKSLADKSSTYTNEEGLYDLVEIPYTGVQHYVLNEEKLQKNVDDLIPAAIMYSAGFIDAIYDYITGNVDAYGKDECLLEEHFLNPGGDHPDDRFDVSDEFYWEKEYGFSNADLANLYLRTAIKKGKVGVWYWKRFMELYATAITQYADASQEVKDAKEAEIKAMGKKVEERSNYAESDWKGAPDIALFTYGFYKPSISLLLKYKEPVAFKGLDFDPAMVKDHPIMVIPSGGLYGLENSSMLKAQLAEYVKQGGTLVVFAQQHGYEFSILPVPQEQDGTFKTITGYGWTEDQSCLWNGTYVDTYHQMLSAISTSTVSANVDGYFTNYPSNSTILLRRTANGQPAMIAYDYGLGKVIISSLFSDWGYAHSQATQDELKIVRDMISWAKAPATLPEIKPGQSVSVQMEVKNNTATDAASVKLLIYNPDRTAVIGEQSSVISIPAGSSSQLITNYSSLVTDVLGIYHIDYELYDANGNLIQSQAETDSGRFIVSNPPANPYKSADLNFAVNSDSEHFLYGTDATFTVTIWNNSDAERNITVNYYAYHLNVSGSPKTVIVPAHSSTSFQIIATNIWWEGWLVVKFHDENNKYMTERWKGIWMVYPSAAVSVQPGMTQYVSGETVTMNTTLRNTTPENASWQADVKVTVSDPQNIKIFEDLKTVNFSSSGNASFISSFIMPSGSKIGTYTIKADVYSGTRLSASGSNSYQHPDSQIRVTPNLPVFNAGSNIIHFTLDNIGKVNVASGVFDMTLKNPDGIVVYVYTGTQPFSLQVAQSIAQSVNISIPSLKLGNYTLTYTQSDETRTGKPTSITIPNTATIALSLDQQSYRIRETANLTVNLTNTGKFNQDNVSVTVAVPDAVYTNTQTVSVPVQVSAEIPLPETMTAGQHDVNVTLTLPSGSSITQSSKLTISESSLSIEYSGPTNITAGDTINLAIENTGGVDTSYTTEKLSITDSKGITIYEGNPTGTIQAGQVKTLADIQIPSNTANGSVSFNVKVKDSKTGNFASFSKPLDVTGITLDLQTQTDKEMYLKTEAITGITSILNEQFGIEGGSLKITVTGNKTSSGEFRTIVGGYGSGDGQFNYPYGISTDTNYIYVTDANNSRIQIFNKTTYAFVGKFGSFGSGDSQFNYPRGISTDANYLYVLDTNNHRVQVFNKTTYAFVGKFGSKGSSDGQFNTPIGISTDADYIYVADTNNSRVQIFNKTTYAFVGKFGSWGGGDGEFDAPYVISTDANYIYVADTNNQRVQVFNKTTYAFVGKFGSYGAGDSQFSTPLGISTDDDYIYVLDWNNNRVQIFNKTTYAFVGKFGSYGTGDGQFNNPRGISTDDNYIYVADTSNHRVQKMTPSSGSFGTLFETTIPISQSANTSQDYTTTIGTLNTTGKLYLNAELKNSLGQTIATSEYPFYIVDGNTVLLYSTDKKFYKPNETVTITGEVQNRTDITASALSLQLSANSQNLYSATLDVPANGTHPFTIITTAGSEGIYSLTGKVTQNNSTLVEIADQYEVAQPKVSVSVSVSETVGNELFDINVEMKNEGKVAATIDARFMMQDTSLDAQTITIPAGETKVIQYSQQITTNTTYTFTFTGDLSQTITKTVAYGLSASIAFSNQQSAISSTYPEGKVAIPVTITNTGSLDENVVVNYQLSALSSQLSASAKTYFIPKGGSVTDTLYYDLTEGSYQLTAVSIQPSATASANFSVRKENKVEMTVVAGVSNQVSGDSLIPVIVNLTNLGYNEINGSVQLSLLNGQGTSVWNSEQTVSLPYTLLPTPYTLTFNINPAAIAPGDYTLKAELLNNSNQQIAVSSQPLTIKGSVFQITQLPSYQTFTAGQEASFTFKVKNTGNQEGAFDLNLKAYDLINSTQTEWLKVGEEKEIAFSFMLPEDLEEKDYYADYTLTPALSPSGEGVIKGQVKYHVAGINLNVNATLDKQYYSEGETAHLTIAVSSQQSALSQNLFARVNYNGYENQQAFTLTSTSTLTFDIPLTQITGEKLFYGIYHEGGRSIHLNSLYIYKAGDAITITTDKQVYAPNETVSVTVNSVSGTTGALTLTAPNYEETFEFAGTAAKSFNLPSTMTAGTYSVSATLISAGDSPYSTTSSVNGDSPLTTSHSFDVNGIQVKVLECKNDKGKYASTDTIKTSFTISSNTTMPAILKAWIVDPDGKYTSVGEANINLLSSEPLLFTDHYSLFTASSGIHRLVYGIYTGEMLLVSGSEAFDVGDAVLLGLSTDKTDYPENTVPVTVSVSMFGTVDASFELQLDGATVKSEAVALNGFQAVSSQLSAVSPGTHTLKGILTAGGLKSTKETSFVYGSNLPDVTTGVRDQGLGVSKDNTIQITATVINQGKTPSAGTTVSLYDNDSQIETKTVKALNSGESQEIIFIWNVLGKAGEHVIKVIADPDNTVTEFNEDNNTSTTNITMPDITLATETDKDTYKIRQKVNINSFITNLTSAKTYQNLILMTSAKDSSGNEVFQKNTVIASLLPTGSTQLAETWNTSGLPVDGTYTITQTITFDSQLLAQSSKLIALQKAPDFTLSTDTDYRKIKQGERATYTAYIEQVNGWITEIALGIEGLPAGTSVSFSPGTLIPPGSALTVIITTEATTPGIHNLSLTAQGIDEGETVTHTLPLILDVSGFGLSSEASSRTIKQLETATFDIKLDAMNGYEGEVNLSVEGVPYGVKAFIGDSPDSTAFQAGKSGTVPVTVLTSKYARPGDYTLTVTGDDGLVKHKLNLSLVLQSNPQISAGIITAQGPGPNNQAEIKVFNSTLQTVLDMTAFDTKYGANAIGADIDGDGYDEIIASQGPDPKNSAALKAFRRNGAPIAEYTAFDTKYGLTLSSGDIDGDWKDEIIVGMGPDPKNSATMKILKYNGAGFTEVMTQTVFDTKYGLNTAIGDVDGDGMQEIITTAGPGADNPAIVKIWKKDGQNLSELYSFTAFDGSYGANIATGDIDGDGKAEIIVGTGPDPKNPAIVRVFKSDGTLVKELLPYDAKYGYGVTVASVDLDGDGRDEIITGLGSGPQNPSWVKVFRYDGLEIYSFISYPDSVKYGVKVSKGNIGGQ